MDSQNLPSPNDKSFIEKLKKTVNQFLNISYINTSGAINSLSSDESYPQEIRYAAASIVEKEARRIRNIKQIIDKASRIKPDEIVSAEKMDDDWISRFFNTIEDVTENTMQNLWAQILAGEVKHPHSFSLRTLDVLRNMTKDDAELFSNSIRSYYYDGYILTEDNYGLNLEDRIALCEMGLLSPDELTKTITITRDKEINRINKDYLFFITKENSKSVEVHFRCRSLTRAGKELLILVEQGNNYDLFAYIANMFKKAGVSTVSLHKVKQWKEDNSVDYYIFPEKRY